MNLIPMISVIIPLYNKKNSIEATVRSVTAQSYSDWECVVVDDGSTDSSANIVLHLAETDSRIRLIRQENRGVSFARNHGVADARGEYVIFLDADDRLLPNALADLYATIHKYGTRISCGRACYESKGSLRRSFTTLSEGVIKDNFKEWVRGNYSPRAGCALFHRDILLRHPNRTDLSRYEDAESLCGILREERIAYTPKFVFVYCGEFAALSRNLCFERDFASCLPFEAATSHWERLFLVGIMADGMACYGEERMRELYAPWFSLLKERSHIGYWRRTLRLNRWIRIFEKLHLLMGIK